MTANEIYESSINAWSKNRGIGTISYDMSLNLFTPIKIILDKYYARNPNKKVVVILPDNARQDEWISKLITNFNHYDKIGNNLLQFLTADTIIVNNIKEEVELVIIDKIERFIIGNRPDIIKQKYIKFKYIVGLTNDPYPDGDGFLLSEFCPVIKRITKVDVVTHGINESTIEYNLPAVMNDNDKIMYNDYNKFIKDTIDLFGAFDTVLNCYHGDSRNGVSADYFRNQLAMDKGWSSDLDLSNEYYRSIDRYYNPNNLYERAKTFSDVIKSRQQLLSDNSAKIDVIIELLKNNKDKKVLIINKRSDFAREVCNAINANIKGVKLKQDLVKANLFSDTRQLTGDAFVNNAVCVEYHSDVESRPLLDPDTGDYVRIKSGKNAGSIKQFGATSLNKIANARFDDGYHNIISSVSAIPKEGTFEIDFIIITSPECNTLNQIQYRVALLKFKENVKIVNIYLKDTREHNKLQESQALTTNKIIEVDDVKSVIL